MISNKEKILFIMFQGGGSNLKSWNEYTEPEKRFGKDININQKLKEFYDEIKKHKLEDIICIDETSISGLQKRSHCYSELGKRCVIKTQSQ